MKIEKHLKFADEPSLDELFVMRKANEWIMGAKQRPIPKMLFDEFWMEGDLAVLAASAGAGKSVLGVQIADAISRGRAIQPLRLTAKPQRVLYIDLKLSDKQFEMRYAAEYDEQTDEFQRKHYKFSDKFHRVEIDPSRASCEAVLPRIIERLVEQTGARVVIIDSISHIYRSAYGYHETFTLMKELRRLKRETGISILVLARSAAPGGASRLLTRFADSVFTIGISRHGEAGRYLLHSSSHSTGMTYDPSHVPTFQISRIGGNFLGFSHEGFSTDRADVGQMSDWPLIERIHEMHARPVNPMSIREIAAELGLPKSNVHRMLQMWTPEKAERRASLPTAQAGPIVRADDFPGREEYDNELAAGRFRTMYEYEDEDDYALRREYNDISNARHAAFLEYRKTGKSVALGEMMLRKKTQAAEAVHEDASSNPSDSTHLSTNGIPPYPPPDPRIPPGLKRDFDGYGKERFIQEEDQNGKPMLWYQTNSKGVTKRFERKGVAGIIVTVIE